MLRIGTHQYQSGKRTYRLIVEYVLEQLITGAVRYGMVDACMIVYVLVLIGNCHATEVYLGSFSCQQYFSGVAGSTIMQSHSVEQYIAEEAKKAGGTMKVTDFVRFEKGEGLEKRNDDFASEVANMVK